MAVREFDGVDDLLTVAGTGFQFFNGAFSTVTIMRAPAFTSGQGYMNYRSGASWAGGLEDMGGGRLRFYNPAGNEISPATTTMDVDTWAIFSSTKASGSVQGKNHEKPLGSGTWQQNAGGSTFGADTTSVTGIRFGNADTTNFKNYRLAVHALFTTELSDADVQSIQTTPSTQKLADLGAVHLWDFNQASTATAVEDLIGDWDQTALTGTTVVVGDDPPGWTHGLGGGPVWPPVDTPPGPALRVVRSNLRLG